MTTEAIHLIGAGGHGRVVADVLTKLGIIPDAILFRDSRVGLKVNGRPVLTPDVPHTMTGESFHVAVGSASIRARLHFAALAAGGKPMTVVHPAAVVADGARLGAGAFVAALAVVAPSASIGVATIVNHGAVVDHDCRLGDFCHIAPNATLGGDVQIGNRVMIGAGAVVLPATTIADDVTIGAGAVVLRAIGEPGTWVGNPARRITE